MLPLFTKWPDHWERGRDDGGASRVDDDGGRTDNADVGIKDNAGCGGNDGGGTVDNDGGTTDGTKTKTLGLWMGKLIPLGQV